MTHRYYFTDVAAHHFLVVGYDSHGKDEWRFAAFDSVDTPGIDPSAFFVERNGDDSVSALEAAADFVRAHARDGMHVVPVFETVFKALWKLGRVENVICEEDR